MLKLVSIVLLAALLVGCTALEEAPAPTQEPAATPAPTEGTRVPPEPVAPPVGGQPTATATPTPTPIPTKTFTTDYEVCEDMTETWYCLTDDHVTTCTLTGINAPSYTPSEITVMCFDYDSLDEKEEFVIQVGDAQ